MHDFPWACLPLLGSSKLYGFLWTLPGSCTLISTLEGSHALLDIVIVFLKWPWISTLEGSHATVWQCDRIFQMAMEFRSDYLDVLFIALSAYDTEC